MKILKAQDNGVRGAARWMTGNWVKAVRSLQKKVTIVSSYPIFNDDGERISTQKSIGSPIQSHCY